MHNRGTSLGSSWGRKVKCFSYLKTLYNLSFKCIRLKKGGKDFLYVIVKEGGVFLLPNVCILFFTVSVIGLMMAP
jgi:hypothetical protein